MSELALLRATHQTPYRGAKGRHSLQSNWSKCGRGRRPWNFSVNCLPTAMGTQTRCKYTTGSLSANLTLVI